MVRAFLKDKRAASAVEFALISPFMLMLLAAILAYGSIFATSLSLQQLAAETARATIGGLSDNERRDLAQAKLAATETSYPLLNASFVTFDFDEGDSSKLSRITLSYDMASHPAYAFENLLPLPASPLTYSMIVTDGDGAGS